MAPKNVTLTNTEMGVNLNASWSPISYYCTGYIIVVKDVTIGEYVRNVTVDGCNTTKMTLWHLHYLHNFSIAVKAFNPKGSGPSSLENSSLAFASTYESGKDC